MNLKALEDFVKFNRHQNNGSAEAGAWEAVLQTLKFLIDQTAQNATDAGLVLLHEKNLVDVIGRVAKLENKS